MTRRRSSELEMGGGPAYRQIADKLRAAILTGSYADEDPLPGENQLMERFMVSRSTARQALAILQSEGLAVARRGIGVFTRRPHPVVRRASQRLSRTHWGQGKAIWDADATDQGRTYTVDSLDVRREACPDTVAEQLGIEVGSTVCVRSRRFLVDGRPVQLAFSRLPWELVAGSRIVEPDTGPGGTYARLAELGHAPATFTEQVLARMPLPEEARRLDLPPGVPVVAIVRLARTEEGRPVEVTEMILDSGYYVLEYDFSA